MTDDLEAAKERAWLQLARIDADLARGRIDEYGWHAAVLAIVQPTYLSSADPRAQSGLSGDARHWRYARQLLIEALPGDCCLLDVGCANGHLMNSLVDWAKEIGTAVEPYGVEISAALADLARRRCPQWASRIWTANVLGWRPPMRFDVVRTGLEYVPPGRQADLLDHLIEHVVGPGGRLVIGVFNEERDADVLEAEVGSWGYAVAGHAARPHRHPSLAYKTFWLDSSRDG